MGVSGQLPRPLLSSPDPWAQMLKQSAPQNQVAMSPSRLLQADSCWPQHSFFPTKWHLSTPGSSVADAPSLPPSTNARSLLLGSHAPDLPGV